MSFFIRVRDCLNGRKHLINLNNICDIAETEVGTHFVIQLNDLDGTFVRIDKDTFDNLEKVLLNLSSSLQEKW